MPDTIALIFECVLEISSIVHLPRADGPANSKQGVQDSLEA
jgi:hypothetical protein